MDPVRQKWIYTFFMHPFLAGKNKEGNGCVSPEDTTENWLIKNFGPYSAMASFKDFTALNVVFTGLDVLHLLTPEQKAELLLHPELTDLDNSTLKLVLQSLLNPLLEHQHQNDSANTHIMTTSEPIYYLTTTVPPSAPVKSHKAFASFLDFLRPLGSFAKQFVSLVKQKNFASMKSTTIIQAVMNLTLSELADFFVNKSTVENEIKPTSAPEDFDITNINDWFMHVVVPVLKRFLPNNQTMIPQNLSAVFHHVFYLNNNAGPEVSGPPEVCSITLMDPTDVFCSVPDAIENLAYILNCTSQTNLSLTEENVMALVIELSKALNSLLESHSTSNFSSFNPPFGQPEIGSFTEENLQDVNFIRLWFHIKLQPYLPSVSNDFLFCLSTRNLTCDTFQALVQDLSDNIFAMDERRQMFIYKYFIYNFLSRHDVPDLSCISQTNNSMDWLTKNFGEFSIFASIQDFYKLNKNFSALEVLNVLSPNQKAELVVFPTEGPEAQTVIINTVFEYFLESPVQRNFEAFLSFLVLRSLKVNMSCDSYKTILENLNEAISAESTDLESRIITIRDEFTYTIPQDCIKFVFSEKCLLTTVNETKICKGINSTAIYYNLGNSNIANTLCNYSIEEYSCTLAAKFTKENLVTLLRCELAGNNIYSVATWKILFTKFSSVLDDALDSYSATLNNINNSLTTSVLNAIEEVKIINFSNAQLQNISFISKWFQRRLQPFLPSVSRDFLSCLNSKNFSCETYQAVVKGLSNKFSNMSIKQQLSVYTDFIKVYLSQTNRSDPGCILNISNSADWLGKNLGKFSELASFSDIQILMGNFSMMDALPLLSLDQLTELACTPGQLKNPGDVDNLMRCINDSQLAVFFSAFSTVIQGHKSDFPSSVLSAMLQKVFDRQILLDPSISNAEVLNWLQVRLRPLLTNMSTAFVEPIFSVIESRDCTTAQKIIELLNSIRPTLQADTQKKINNQILNSLKGSDPLRCYLNGSFYAFLDCLFLGSAFPNLSTVLSLMPHSQKPQLINSMSPADLGSMLRQPNFVDSGAELCTVLNYYNRTSDLLETEEIPDDVKGQILPCVWPLALSSENKADSDAWFDQRLKNYLQFLNKDLISATAMLNASCLSFQKFVSVLGNSFNYNGKDFDQMDVYDTIRTYLSTGTKPKCYNATDPNLNSTAWFVGYIGSFISFVTLDDLTAYGSTELQVFALDPANIQLFNNNNVPQNVSSFYTELIYQQDPNFNPFLLPRQFRCDAPGSSFSQLNTEETMIILQNISQICGQVDSEIITALAGNLAFTKDAIQALGQQCAGFTTTQISKAPLSVIQSSLGTLSTVTDWDEGQMIAIIQRLLLGNIEINSGQKLLELGSLVGGVPSEVFLHTDPSQLLSISENPTFIGNIMNAPEILQYIFVDQIIKINSSPEALLLDVPDVMATQIPRSLLDFPSVSTHASMIDQINRKRWKPEQAALFFDTVANRISNANNISADVLQGFSCSRVQGFANDKVIKIVKACGKQKQNIVLQEPQLTCMYNFIKGNQLSAYAEYPAEMLLYYNYDTDVKDNCTSYFSQLRTGKFSILSDMLSYKKDLLLQNAKLCLGITGTSLHANQVEVLGNMVCTLSGSYIGNSDPLILEKLKNCDNFSSNQVSAMEKLLFTGTTRYGNVSTWGIQTLNNLNILPLYLTSNFWSQFKYLDKITFLKSFLKTLRNDRTDRSKLRNLFNEFQKSLRFKRAAGCTGGAITAVTISGDTFPFGYDITQFDSCLSNATVKENLALLSEKVNSLDYQSIILAKLNQAYPSGIADEQVQLLGPISLVASLDDISKWNITKIDTLSALMASSNGEWDPSKSNAVIMKYLSTTGNVLGSAELNAIGANLCSLNITVLKNISSASLRNANALSVSNCSLEQKEGLFKIALNAFSNQNITSLTIYQLIQPYIGGSNISYIKNLCYSNVSMDLPTFMSLDQSVVNALNVTDVKYLLGLNLPELKTYENVTTVRNWINLQYRSDLQTLGLNLTGGQQSAATTRPGISNYSTITTKTTSSGANGQTKSVQILFYVLLLFSLHAD